MKASQADQRILLDVADIDRRLKHAEHQRTNPAHTARIAELAAQRATQTQELMQRIGVRDDLKAEIGRIESDVTTARARRERDKDRLTSASAKDAVALENEIASLAKRLSDLEDAELEAMEKLETAESGVAEQEAIIASTNAEGSRLTAEAKAQVADATTAVEQLRRDRDAVAATVPEALLAQYDRLARTGTGAGLLRARMCEACRMELAGSDLAEVAAAASDEVVFCPQCGAILVRTDESGL